MTWGDFGPFWGLPQTWDAGLPPGYNMAAGTSGWEAPFSTEGMIGGRPNPWAPHLSGATGGADVGTADTDKGRAGVDVSAAAAKGGGNLQNVLKGLQAPAAPQPQRIGSPPPPQTRAVNSQMSTLLASMGVSPQQLLRLGDIEASRRYPGRG